MITEANVLFEVISDNKLSVRIEGPVFLTFSMKTRTGVKSSVSIGEGDNIIYTFEKSIIEPTVDILSAKRSITLPSEV